MLTTIACTGLDKTESDTLLGSAVHNEWCSFRTRRACCCENPHVGCPSTLHGYPALAIVAIYTRRTGAWDGHSKPVSRCPILPLPTRRTIRDRCRRRVDNRSRARAAVLGGTRPVCIISQVALIVAPRYPHETIFTPSCHCCWSANFAKIWLITCGGAYLNPKSS